MRLVFMATGDIALPSFRRLLERGLRPMVLVTQPDKPVGRHQTLMPPAIKLEALEAGIPVLQPAVVGDAAARLGEWSPEVIVVMAYGQILKRNILELPSLAIINLHASLLPRHRGASCIQAAIAAGDKRTGITAMHVVPRLDAGDVIHAKSLRIETDDTGGSLHDKLAELAPDVLVETLRRLANGSAGRVPQDESLVTYAPKLGRDDGKVDWTLPAADLDRRIRAYDPWPGSYTMVMEGGVARRLKLFAPVGLEDADLAPGRTMAGESALLVGCGAGALGVREVQPEGSRRMGWAEYLRGRPLPEFI
jgi:methionyl-tRNA formyltransferase